MTSHPNPIIMLTDNVTSVDAELNPYRSPPGMTDATLRPRMSLLSLFTLFIVIPVAMGMEVLILTDRLEKFFGLVFQAMFWPIALWLLVVPILIWCKLAYDGCRERGELQSRQLLWFVPQIVLPITMLVWGALFAHRRGEAYEAWQLAPLQGMFFVVVALALLGILFNRGRRSFVIPLTLLLVMNAFFCCFTGECSVTGNWL